MSSHRPLTPPISGADRLWGALGLSALLTLAMTSFPGDKAWADTPTYEFSCEGDGVGLDLVSVLEATGEHTTFLELIRLHDPEGYSILAEVTLADKTVWAPTDAAFSEIDAVLANLNSAQVKEVLGNHISPPRRTPTGQYPIVTPDFLISEGELSHRTRTGVLAGTEQRIRSSVVGGQIRVENATVLPVSWCAEAGSVFSLDSVITEVTPPSSIQQFFYQAERTLFYNDSRFIIWPTVVSLTLGALIALVVHRAGNKGSRGSNSIPD